MAAFRFLYSFLVWTGTVAAGVAVVIFAISNRAPAMLELWPFALAFEVPLFVLPLAGMVAGAALAALAGGASLLRLRVRLRNTSRELAAAKRQLAHARARGAELDARLHRLPAAGAAGADEAGDLRPDLHPAIRQQPDGPAAHAGQHAGLARIAARDA